jgi:beta-lactamase regulating signal transducer with metallopeptidase domain
MADLLTAVQPIAHVVVQAAAGSLAPGALLAAAVGLGLRHARPAAATRHAAWFAALLLIAAMPVGSALAGRSPDAARSSESIVPTARGVTVGTMDAASSRQIATNRPTASSARPMLHVPGGRWVVVPFAVIVAGAALNLLRLLAALAAVARLRATSRALPEADERLVRRFVGGEAAWMGVPLRLTDRLQTPATVGFVRPAILLPPRVLDELAPGELRAVMLHELAHVRRGDLWTNLAQRALAACLWWHPAVRWTARRLELEREMACDEAVVRAVGHPLAYARSLTRLAANARAARVPALATAAAPRAGHLACRVEALVAHARRPQRSPSAVRRAFVLALTATGGVVLVAFAPGISLADGPLSRPQALAAMPLSPIVQTAARPIRGVDAPSEPASSGLTIQDREHPRRTSTEKRGSAGPARAAALPDVRPDAAVATADAPATVGMLASLPSTGAPSGSTRDAAAGRGRGELAPARPAGGRTASRRRGFVASAYVAGDGPLAPSGRSLADLPGVAASNAGRFVQFGTVKAFPRPRIVGLGGW